MTENKPTPEGDEEFVTLRLHLRRETRSHAYGTIDVIVPRTVAVDMQPDSILASQLVESLTGRHCIDWNQGRHPVCRTEIGRISPLEKSDHVYRCRYDETNGKWYFRSSRSGKA